MRVCPHATGHLCQGTFQSEIVSNKSVALMVLHRRDETKEEKLQKQRHQVVVVVLDLGETTRRYSQVCFSE